MHRTAPRLRTDPAARLTSLEQKRPEWGTWLALLGEVNASPQSRVESRESPVASRHSRSPEAPLLHGRTLEIDADGVHQLLLRLLSIAARGDVAGGATLRDYRPSQAEAVATLMAAVRQQSLELSSMAEAAGVDRGALTSVAHLTAYPLLQACGRLLRDQLPAFWPHGYCPVCAAWPILAERRGLDRSRRMRCGRCAGEWEIQWLCCVYCGERDHERLGSLVPDDTGEMLKVETCANCRGYLKSLATLQGMDPFELLLRDLETVELDLAALDRGFGRPEECGFQLEVHLA
jgi:FdhE protein